MKNRPPPSRPFRDLSGEKLRMASRAADRALSAEIDRLRATDPGFQRALRLAMAYDEEIAERKNR